MRNRRRFAIIIGVIVALAGGASIAAALPNATQLDERRAALSRSSGELLDIRRQTATTLASLARSKDIFRIESKQIHTLSTLSKNLAEK